MTSRDTPAGPDQQATPPSRLTAIIFRPGKRIHEHIPPSQISEVLKEEKTLLWLDISHPEPSDGDLLQEEFGLHPLAIEELMTTHLRPKCAEFPGGYVLVMYAIDAKEDQTAALREVVIFIGPRFLITTHRASFPEIEECIRRWQSNAGLQQETIAAPVYSLLDTLVDGYFPAVDQIAEKVDGIEDRLFEGNGASTQGPEIFSLKKELLSLRRAVAGQRDALNLILRQDIPLFTESALIYLQSVYDHLVRLTESIDTYRDLLASALDMHLSVLSNRMNQVMKVLTVISTILMTSSLIAGIYGMNFENMPELHTRYGYFVTLGAMATISAGLVAFFRRIRWL